MVWRFATQKRWPLLLHWCGKSFRRFSTSREATSGSGGGHGDATGDGDGSTGNEDLTGDGDGDEGGCGCRSTVRHSDAGWGAVFLALWSSGGVAPHSGRPATECVPQGIGRRWIDDGAIRP